MQSEWPLVSVAECCDLIVDCVNKTAPVVEAVTPFRMIRTPNVRDGFIDLTDCKFVDEATFRTWTRRATVIDGDVILTREAPIGQIGLVRGNQEIFLGQRLMQYRANRLRLDPRFLCYAFLSPQLQHQFGAHEGSGSVVSHIRVGDCSKFKIPLPSLSVQRGIAELLGSIDERALLLRQTNATLESIAQALFKSWFIDFDPVRAKAEGREPEGMDAATAALFPAEFEESALGLIPKGWRAGKFGTLATLSKTTVNPLTAPGTTFEHYSLPAFDVAQLPVFELGEAIKSNKTRFPPGAVLQSKLNPHIPRVWFPGNVGKQAVCSTEFLPWVAREGASSELVYCLLSSDQFSRQVQTLVTGTSNSHQRVKPDLVANLDVVAAPAEINARFAELAAPLFTKVAANRLQANGLANLRDTLLPRLISGKLRLPEAQAQMEALE